MLVAQCQGVAGSRGCVQWQCDRVKMFPGVDVVYVRVVFNDTASTNMKIHTVARWACTM